MTDEPTSRRRRGRTTRRAPLDVPRSASRRPALSTPNLDPEMFGRWSEAFARFMGTAQFIVGMTVFVGAWLAWNTYGPAQWQFDPRELNYTLLTLILSLQASYAAPLILLAQNRQADRDRVALEQDRQRAERNIADTEYLAREVAALRIALRDVATRDFLRSELRDLLEELLAQSAPADADETADAPVAPRPKRKKPKSTRRDPATKPQRPAEPEATTTRDEDSPDDGTPDGA